MKKSVQVYMVEAKWLHGKYIPTIEEYMDVARVSIGVPMFTIFSSMAMGEMANKEVFDSLRQDPKIVRASSNIIRLMDDLALHKVQ